MSHIQCSKCRVWYPVEQKVKGYKMCKKCVEESKRKTRENQRKKRIEAKRRQAEGDWSWSGSGASIFW